MEYSPAGSGANALQRVVFIVQFSKEFSKDDFERFERNSGTWRDELPRRSVTNAVRLQPGSNQVTLDESEVTGLAYEAMMKDGSVEFGLRIDKSRILFLVGRYTRWGEIWSRANDHLKMAMELAPSDNPVVSFATEYTDLFRATGNYSDFDASCFLCPNSQYVPSHIFDRTENFHFHTGFFQTLYDPAKHRMLTRINADLNDNEEKRSRDLSIVLFHQMSSHREPWGGDAGLDKKIIDRGLENFVELHEFDKSVLKEILNDEMSTKTGL